MYKRSELSATLPKEEMTRTLHLCGLLEKEKYSEEEADRFRYCRQLIEQKKTDLEIAELLHKHSIMSIPEADPSKISEAKKSKNGLKLDSDPDASSEVKPASPPISEPKSISELLQLAGLQIGKNISLAQTINILQICGLSENSLHYSPQECESFLSAWRLMAESSNLDLDFEPEINEIISALPEQNGALVSEIIRQKAKADASGAAQLYLKSLASEFGSPEFQQAWREMEAAVKAKIVGKFRPQTQYSPTIQLSPSPSTALPEASGNSSTTQ